MARVVVTGAAGFIGGAVAHALRGRGDEVVALDVAGGPGVLSADVTRPGGWEKELAGADLVVHAAAAGMGGVGELPPIRAGRPVGDARVSPARVRQVLLGGTAAVLDAAARGGVGRLVHISCVCVLGPQAPDGADETAPVGLTGDPRADTLAAAEQAVSAAAATGLPATVLRLGDAYGPRAGRWTIWPVLLLRANRFVLLDGGTGRLNPVHIDDVVSAVIAAASSPRTVGETLHVTGPEPSTVAEFVGHYARMLGVPAPRSVPARVYGALDDASSAFARLRARGAQAEPDEAAAAPAPAPANVSPAGAAVAGLVRGVGARLIAGLNPRGRIDLGPLSVADVTRAGSCSADRITQLSGWRPRVPLADGMASTEAWLRDRGLLGVREPVRR
ncbi:MAG: NAD(P)-dependent oxidoreductase [Frankia sp.]|nr:NAD(P)-dependent oxidoreductase [Frankia sp.]